MAYSDFTLPRVLADFGLRLVTTDPLFAAVGPVPVSAGLAAYWANTQQLGLALLTEKARSEILVSPLLNEVWHRSGRRVTVWSGIDFAADPAAGLTGVCDFVLGVSRQTLFVEAPVLAVVEAKRDSIPDGFGQCAAEMVAAQRFNHAAGRPPGAVYGCVTTGAAWRFLKLDGDALFVDTAEHAVTDADRILGVLLHCCGVAA